MVYRPSSTDLSPSAISTKIVIVGGFGVGKTTFVRSISEIEPVTTEALMSEASAETDDLSATPEKTTTTVAMDFGRVSLDADLALYLFGTPGQDRRGRTNVTSGSTTGTRTPRPSGDSGSASPGPAASAPSTGRAG